jgi:hypothetical protein
MINRKTLNMETPFPSPEDWRDQWICFLMVDRFNDPQASPNRVLFDGTHGVFGKDAPWGEWDFQIPGNGH